MSTRRSKMNAQKRKRLIDRPVLKDRLAHWVRGEDLMNCDNRTEILQTRNMMNMKPGHIDDLRKVGFLNGQREIEQKNPAPFIKIKSGNPEFSGNRATERRTCDDIRKMKLLEKPDIPKREPVRGVPHDSKKKPEILRYGYEKGVTDKSKENPEIYGQDRGVTDKSNRHHRETIADRKIQQKFVSENKMNPNVMMDDRKETVEENSENFICDCHRLAEDIVEERHNIMPKFQDTEPKVTQIRSDPTLHPYSGTFEREDKEPTTDLMKSYCVLPPDMTTPREGVKEPRSEKTNCEPKSLSNKIPLLDTTIKTLPECAIFDTRELNENVSFISSIGSRGDIDETGKKERDIGTVVMTANKVQLVVDGKEIPINVNGKGPRIVKRPPKIKHSWISRLFGGFLKSKKKKKQQDGEEYDDISISSTQSMAAKGTNKKQVKSKKVSKDGVSKVKGQKDNKEPKAKKGNQRVVPVQTETQKSKGDNEDIAKDIEGKAETSENESTQDDDEMYMPYPSVFEPQKTTESPTSSTPSSTSTTESPKSTQSSTNPPGSIREVEIQAQKRRKEREEKERRKKEESPFQERYRRSYAFNLRKRVTKNQPVFSTYFVEHYRRFGKPPFWNYSKAPESFNLQYKADFAEKPYEEVDEPSEPPTSQAPVTSKPQTPYPMQHEPRKTTKKSTPSTKTPKPIIASKKKDKKKSLTQGGKKSTKEIGALQSTRTKVEKKDKTKLSKGAQSNEKKVKTKGGKSKPKAAEHVGKDAKNAKNKKSKPSTSSKKAIPPTRPHRKKNNKN